MTEKETPGANDDKDARIAELEGEVKRLSRASLISVMITAFGMIVLDLVIQSIVPNVTATYKDMLAGEPLPGLTVLILHSPMALFFVYVGWPTLASLVAILLLNKQAQLKTLIRAISVLFLLKVVLTIFALSLPFVKLVEQLC